MGIFYLKDLDDLEDDFAIHFDPNSILLIRSLSTDGKLRKI